MSNIDRVSLPENFYDITSATLLTQPDPQFLYAQMFRNAIAASLDTSSAEVGMPFRDNYAAGAQYSSADRDRLMLADPVMSGVFVPGHNFTGTAGNVVRFNRPSFTDSTYTEASREIKSNQTISTDTQGVESEQVSLVLKRFAGPYNNTAAGVRPYGIDRFAAAQGIHSLNSMVRTHLKRDYDKFIDTRIVALLDEAATVVRPAGMTDDNTPTAADQFPLDLATLQGAELEADELNLPQLPDGNRIYVATPKQINDLQKDGDFIEYAKQWPQYNSLFPNYIASVGKLHIFKSNTLSTATNTSSIPIHKGHLIAPGALLAGMGRPPQVVSATDDNYGETAKIIWRADLAMGVADDRFTVSVRTC